MDADFTDSVQYGSLVISYSVLRVDRSTLDIAVQPDMSLVLRAPLDATPDQIRKKVYKRRRWIAKKLRFFSQFHPRTEERQFISGETHLYLGRQYKLRVVLNTRKQAQVVMGGGYIQVTVPSKDPRLVKAALDTWYKAKARSYFEKIMDQYISDFLEPGGAKPILDLRFMRTRWGSLSRNSRLTLNPRLIQAPRSCVEYVIIHELCHLREPNHSSTYYALLNEHLPDWKRRKYILEDVLS